MKYLKWQVLCTSTQNRTKLELKYLRTLREKFERVTQNRTKLELKFALTEMQLHFYHPQNRTKLELK